MIFTQTKLITHSPAGLVIGRRIENGDGHPAFNKISTASNQKVILTEFDLTLFLAQPNQAAGAGKQNSYGLRIFPQIGDKERLRHARPCRERHDLLAIAAALPNSNRNAASTDKNARRPAANFSRLGLTIDVFPKPYFFTDL